MADPEQIKSQNKLQRAKKELAIMQRELQNSNLFDKTEVTDTRFNYSKKFFKEVYQVGVRPEFNGKQKQFVNKRNSFVDDYVEGKTQRKASSIVNMRRNIQSRESAFLYAASEAQLSDDSDDLVAKARSSKLRMQEEVRLKE